VAQDDDQDDAARAFENLAAEVRVMRRALEALEAKKPVDYAPTLAEFAQKLDKLRLAIATMSDRPALRLTPDSYAAQIGRAADEAARLAAAELQRVQTLAGTFERALGAARTREDQRRQVIWTGSGALAIGVLLCVVLLPPIARALPTSWHVPDRLAAGVIGTNRWIAGDTMMASYAPQAWSRIAQAAELETANRTTLDTCRRNAARTGKPQSCIIGVDAPARLNRPGFVGGSNS
jgi:hypothetical protein